MTITISLASKRGTATGFHALAIVATVFRLNHRRQLRRMWWDDHWALISLLSDIIYLISLWLLDDNAVLSTPALRNLRITQYWIRAIAAPIVVWAARLSIAMSIARLIQPKTTARRSILAMSACFILVCCALLIQKIWVCCQNTSWKRTSSGQCYLGSTVGIISLCTDVIADTCLVVIPIHMLWAVRLPRRQRRLILSIFPASALSSAAGIVYAVLVFNAQILRTYRGALIGLASHIRASVTLLVCNLLVIITYIYRIFWKDENEDVSEPSETRDKPTIPPPPLTVLSFTDISEMEMEMNTMDFSRRAISSAAPESVLSSLSSQNDIRERSA